MHQKRLGDMASYVNGYAFKPEQRGKVGLPIIRIQDLTGNVYDLGFYDGDYPKKVEINDGDVLISWSASLGVYEWNRGKALLNQHIFKVVFDKLTVDKKFFMYAVKYKLEEMESKAHGATMKHITKKDFDNTVISFPTIVEQERISNTLNKLHTIIDSKKFQLEKLDNLIKARFVEMFGSTNNEQVKIAELVEQKISTAKKDFEGDAEIKYIDISSINNRRNTMTGFTKYKMSNAPSRARQHVQFGDIIISTVRPNLKNVAMVSMDSDNLVASSGFCVLRPKKCTSEFLMAIVCSDRFTDAMVNVVTGANYPAIKNSDVLNYCVPLPSEEQQRQFANFVTQVDKSKFAVQKSLEKTQLLFNSLMQEYFG